MARAPLTEGQVGKSPMVTFSLTTEQLAAINDLARRRSVARSEVLRTAIDALLEGEAVA